MKRLAVIIIASAVLGKLFTVVVVRLAENTKTIKSPFKVERLQNDPMENGHATSQLNIAVEKPPALVAPPILPVKKLEPYIIKAETVEAKPKVADEAKKEKERRKKRKKKLEEKNDAVAKKSEGPPAPVVPLMPAAPPQTLPTYVMPGPVAQGPVANGNGTVTTIPQVPVRKTPVVSTLSNPGLARWISLLTKTPSTQAMTSFEALYSKQQISQSDYYQVLTAMVASSNVESKSLAVQGAALYQNIDSFKILADESVNETNQSIKSMASNDTLAYRADVSLLNTALASGDAAEKQVAASLLAQMGVTASL